MNDIITTDILHLPIEDMTEEQRSQLRSEFKSIVWKKSELATNAGKLKTLHAFDKNGSHENAIKKELDKRDVLKLKYTQSLKGETYEFWREKSRLLSVWKAKQKRIDEKQSRKIVLSPLPDNLMKFHAIKETEFVQAIRKSHLEYDTLKSLLDKTFNK